MRKVERAYCLLIHIIEGEVLLVFDIADSWDAIEIDAYCKRARRNY